MSGRQGVAVLRRSGSSRTTIKQVAGLSGVSIKTVSRVINGGEAVSAETLRRVTDAIGRLNYRPNALARGLVTRRSRSIGLVIADIVNPFFPPLVRGVEDTAAAQGYNVILCDTDEHAERERAAVSLLLEKQVDGLILCASRLPASFLREVADSGVLMVLVNRALHHARTASVMVDAAEGGRRATAHLLDLGHRRIGYLSGPPSSSSNAGRLRGYTRALEARGIPFSQELVAGGAASIDAGRKATEALMAIGRRPPTALFAFDDLMAVGALEELRRQGRRVPQDVAVVGFDDIEMAAFVDPPLTTVAQPKADMGRLAAARLLEMIEGTPATGPRVVTLTPELVVRRSCGKHKEAAK